MQVDSFIIFLGFDFQTPIPVTEGTTILEINGNYVALKVVVSPSPNEEEDSLVTSIQQKICEETGNSRIHSL